jgi:AcrR family transcriptional regulator
VSRGAQNHYFRTKNDLVLSACHRAMAIAIENAKAMATEARRSSDVLNYFIDQSRRFFLTRSYIATISRDQAFVLMSLTHNLMRGMAISGLWGTNPAANEKLIGQWRHLVLQMAKLDKGRTARGARTLLRRRK